MTRKLHRLLLLPALLFLLSLPAAAGEDTGWLVKLKPDEGMQPFGILPAMECVSPVLGLYRVASSLDVRDLQELGLVEYAEPDGYVTLLDDGEDPLAAEQWTLERLDIPLADAWDLDGTGVRIGIIDSGVDSAHEDLAEAKLVPGWNVLRDNADTADDQGHGTFIAGVIGACRDNGLGIAGLAPGAELVPIKAFSAKEGTLISHVVAAIDLAIDTYQCDILNLSWGVKTDYQALAEAIERARQAGVIITAAAGNLGTDALYYPAAYEGVIAVGAVDETDTVCTFSQRNETVDLVAPGQECLGLQMGGGYMVGRGTSYSCPVVTAVTALLLQTAPELTAVQAEATLVACAADLGPPGRDDHYGHGLVTVSAMLAHLAAEDPLTLTAGVDGFCLSGRTMALPADGCLIAAAYDEAGRFLACRMLPACHQYTQTLPMGAWGAVFLLDGGLSPCAPPILLASERLYSCEYSLFCA